MQGNEVTIGDGATLKIGGITGNAPLNLNGAPGGTAGATFQIAAGSAATVNSVGPISVTGTS